MYLQAKNNYWFIKNNNKIFNKKSKYLIK